jgi:hypothetical protein
MMARVMLVLCAVLALIVPAAPARAQGSISQRFFGAWCAQGDPTRNASISSSAYGAQATNEAGSTSPLFPGGINGASVVAPAWSGVRGTLDASGSRITWSNGTYWTRCGSHAPVTLSGTWYAQGDPSRACTVVQRYGRLTFTNEQGVTASGFFDGPRHLIATWNGTKIGATLHRGGRRIDWDNGTYWTR